jgi:hypothetical protein
MLAENTQKIKDQARVSGAENSAACCAPEILVPTVPFEDALGHEITKSVIGGTNKRTSTVLQFLIDGKGNGIADQSTTGDHNIA